MCLAVPGKLLSIIGTDPLTLCGRVEFGGLVKEVNLACVPEAQIGDYLLVHVGVALTVVDPQEAQRIFEYLDQVAGRDEWGTPPA